MAFQTKTKPDKDENFKEQPVPELLIAKCHDWMGRGKKQINGGDLTCFATASFSAAPPPQIVVPILSDARRIFRSFDRESDVLGSKSIEMSYLWAKAEEQALRISLIVAASEDAESIAINDPIANPNDLNVDVTDDEKDSVERSAVSSPFV